MPKDRQQALFRPEVQASRTETWLGTVRLRSPLTHTVWSLSAVALVAMLACWLTFGHYTRRQTVSGRLIPTGGLIEITAKTPGRLEQAPLSDGERVRQHDTVAVVSHDAFSETQGSTASVAIAQLKLQIQQLSEAASLQSKLADEEASSLSQQRLSLSEQLIHLDQQRSVELEQLRSRQTILDRLQSLVGRGYVSVFQVEDQAGAVRQSKGRLIELDRQSVDLRRQIRQIESQLKQEPLSLALKEQELVRLRAQAAQGLAVSEVERSEILRAPVEGTISAFVIRPGQSVQAGQVIAAIVPAGRDLEAQLWIPSSAVGFVRDGMRVHLRYHAFPFAKFGIYGGTITYVATSAVPATEVMALLGDPKGATEALYPVRVHLDAQHVKAYGAPQPLRSGMALEADILLDNRRLFEWLFEPLFSWRQRLRPSP